MPVYFVCKACRKVLATFVYDEDGWVLKLPRANRRLLSCRLDQVYSALDRAYGGRCPHCRRPLDLQGPRVEVEDEGGLKLYANK